MHGTEMLQLVPEIWLTSCMLALLMWGCLAKPSSRSLSLATLAILMGTLGFNLLQTGQGRFFGGHLQIDALARFLKSIILITSGLLTLYSKRYIQWQSSDQVEYYFLKLASILGMCILVSGGSFLSLYLGLELLSLPLYALCAYAKDHPTGGEAGIKYFMTGALASGLFLYGLSLVYGVTGSLFPSEVINILNQMPANQASAAVFGFVFIMAGVNFKLGAVPFHMWLPDVYQGASHSVALIIGTLPKVAALGLALRVYASFPASYQLHWEKILLICAVLSIGLGNILALLQSNLKRMLGFSAIAHVGFLLLGLLIAPQRGLSPTLYYLCVYLLMVLGAFASLMSLSREGLDVENIAQLKGLFHYAPAHAWGLLLLFFSMAGVPPTAGFYAKYLILDGLMKSNYQFLSVYSLVFSVIGAFYYLNVIRVMYFEPTEHARLESGGLGLIADWTLKANHMAMLVLGLAPQLLLPWCLISLN